MVYGTVNFYVCSVIFLTIEFCENIYIACTKIEV